MATENKTGLEPTTADIIVDATLDHLENLVMAHEPDDRTTRAILARLARHIKEMSPRDFDC